MRLMNIFALYHAQIYYFSPPAAGNLPKEIEMIFTFYFILICEKYARKDDST